MRSVSSCIFWFHSFQKDPHPSFGWGLSTLLSGAGSTSTTASLAIAWAARLCQGKWRCLWPDLFTGRSLWWYLGGPYPSSCWRNQLRSAEPSFHSVGRGALICIVEWIESLGQAEQSLFLESEAFLYQLLDPTVHPVFNLLFSTDLSYFYQCFEIPSNYTSYLFSFCNFL